MSTERSTEFRIFSSWTRIIFILFLSVSMFFFVAFFVILTMTQSDDLVNVPNVKHQYLVDAYNSIVRSGMKVDIELLDIPELDKGYILSQSPEPGEMVHPGEKLRLRVSRGIRFCKVPDITGITLESAPGILKSVQIAGRSADLKIGQVSYIPTDKAKRGTILSQIPKAGERVRVSSFVHVLVSAGKGSDVFRMGDYRNQNVDLLYDIFSLRGIPVTYRVRKIQDRDRNGMILEQSPAPGTIVSAGKSVALTVGITDEKIYHRIGYEVVHYKADRDYTGHPIEVYIKDRYPRRLRYRAGIGNGGALTAVVRREGDAEITIESDGKVLDTIRIKVNDPRE